MDGEGDMIMVSGHGSKAQHFGGGRDSLSGTFHYVPRLFVMCSSTYLSWAANNCFGQMAHLLGEVPLLELNLAAEVIFAQPTF